MQAIAVERDAKRVRLIDHTEPQLASPGEVELRILDVGVCGTDREIVRFEYGTPPAGCPYLVIGHECVAEVVRASSDVTSVSAGDLVIPMVREPCPDPSCRACRAGRQDFCETDAFTERGIRGRHGYMTERVVVAERYLLAVPKPLRSVAVLVEPLTIAEKALTQVEELQQRLPWIQPGAQPGTELAPDGTSARQRALVLGAGPVGLLGAMALAAGGFDVFVYSREPVGGPKSSIVEQFGGRYVSARDHALAELPRLVGNLDVIYEATGASLFAFQALSALGPNGVFVFTGVPGRKGPVALDTDRMMRDLVLRNQVVLGTVNAGHGAFERAIRDLAIFQTRWPDALAALITARHSPAHFAEALAAPGIKHVIRFAE